MNHAQIHVDLNNVWLHEHGLTQARQVTSIKLKGRERSIRDLIRDDLRTIKRENPDFEGKKQIISKELQKAALGERSPDFGDMLMMRAFFDFTPQPKYLQV